MKVLVICLGALLILSTVLCKSSEESGESKEGTSDSIKKEIKEGLKEIEKELKGFVKSQCESVGGKAAYKKFVQSYEELKTCLEGVLPEEYELPSKICKDKRPLLRSCLEAAIPGINKCVSDSEKWILDEFIIGTINSVFDYACGNMFVSLKELMSLEGFDCLTNIAKNEVAFDNATDLCFSSGASTLNTDDGTSLTKTELCKELDDLDVCLKKAIREQCQTNHGLEYLVDGLIQAFKTPCNTVTSTTR